MESVVNEQVNELQREAQFFAKFSYAVAALSKFDERGHFGFLSIEHSWIMLLFRTLDTPCVVSTK